MLPSIEKLMEEFSVARVTVRQAVRLLSDEGLVSPHRGRGTSINGLPASDRFACTLPSPDSSTCIAKIRPC